MHVINNNLISHLSPSDIGNPLPYYGHGGGASAETFRERLLWLRPVVPLLTIADGRPLAKEAFRLAVALRKCNKIEV